MSHPQDSSDSSFSLTHPPPPVMAPEPSSKKGRTVLCRSVKHVSFCPRAVTLCEPIRFIFAHPWKGKDWWFSHCDRPPPSASQDSLVFQKTLKVPPPRHQASRLGPFSQCLPLIFYLSGLSVRARIFSSISSVSFVHDWSHAFPFFSRGTITPPCRASDFRHVPSA